MEKVYWEDLMERLAKDFRMSVVVKTNKRLETYFPSLKKQN